MKPANSSRRHYDQTRLLVLSGLNSLTHSRVGDIESFLAPGDLLLVNRSATLPASFHGNIERTGERVEVRLAAFRGPSPDKLHRWFAFSFQEGSWREPTEDRVRAPELEAGDFISIGPGFGIKVLSVNSGRLLTIEITSSSLLRDLYRYGSPIQYSYLNENLEVWDQQTIFSGPPLSVEPPSSAFPLTWERVFRLQEKGVKIASLIHGAGISSTGDFTLDNLLPLEEWYEIPEETVAAIEENKRRGYRIIALGTTVIRAVESAGLQGKLIPGARTTNLKIGPDHDFHYIDTLITGMHEPGTSHVDILNSFCSVSHIAAGYKQASKEEYRAHEYGDISLLDCRHCQ